MKNMKQLALCISILALVGCGETPSSDKSQSTGSGDAQSSNALQELTDRRNALEALIDQSKLLEEKINANSAEIQKLTKDLDSEQNIDKLTRLTYQVEQDNKPPRRKQRGIESE